MRYELQSIGVWSIIKVGFFFNLVAGFLLGLMAAPFLGAILTIMLSSPWGGQTDVDPTGFSAVTIFVVVPLISAVVFAALNTLLLAILTVVYNLVATLLGGLEFDFRDVENGQSEIEVVEEVPKPEAAAITTPASPDRRPDTPPPPPPVQDAVPPVAPEIKPAQAEVEPAADSNRENS
jgi:hypothetical protein